MSIINQLRTYAYSNLYQIMLEVIKYVHERLFIEVLIIFLCLSVIRYLSVSGKFYEVFFRLCGHAASFWPKTAVAAKFLCRNSHTQLKDEFITKKKSIKNIWVIPIALPFINEVENSPSPFFKVGHHLGVEISQIICFLHKISMKVSRPWIMVQFKHSK